jgi:hypothetical protein
MAISSLCFLSLSVLSLLASASWAEDPFPPPFPGPSIGLGSASVVSNSVIARIPANRTPNFRFLANVDGSRAAAIDSWAENRWYITVNNILWEFYDHVDVPSAQFSADGSKLFLLALRDRKWFLVCEDRELREFGPLRCRDLIISPDSNRFACIQSTQTSHDRLILDGNLSDPCKEIDSLAFSSDSRRFAAIVRDGPDISIFADGKIIFTHAASRMARMIFTPAGELACGMVLNDEKGLRIARVVDGKIATEFPLDSPDSQVAALAISEDGSHIIWGESLRSGCRLALDGEPLPCPFQDIRNVAISPDNKHIALVGTYPKWHDISLAIDGQALLRTVDFDNQPLAFTRGNLLRFTYNRVPTVAHLEDRKWLVHRSPNSSDGRLQIEKDSRCIFVNDVRIPGSFLAAGAGAPGRTFVVVESPRPVQVNDKTINDVIRVELKGP